MDEIKILLFIKFASRKTKQTFNGPFERFRIDEFLVEVVLQTGQLDTDYLLCLERQILRQQSGGSPDQASVDQRYQLLQTFRCLRSLSIACHRVLASQDRRLVLPSELLLTEKTRV